MLFECSRGLFRSTDLWVMGPARFLCATLLKVHSAFVVFASWQAWIVSVSSNWIMHCDQAGSHSGWFIGELAHLVERSLCMREGPGSTPGFSILCLEFGLFWLLVLYMNLQWIGRLFILGSIVVSIPACHAGDRGSIPRRGGVKMFVSVILVTTKHFKI